MFELADRLVGIYKTHNVTKSVTINPKEFAGNHAQLKSKRSISTSGTSKVMFKCDVCLKGAHFARSVKVEGRKKDYLTLSDPQS